MLWKFCLLTHWMSPCLRSLQAYSSIYFLSTVTQTAGKQFFFFLRDRNWVQKKSENYSGNSKSAICFPTPIRSPCSTYIHSSAYIQKNKNIFLVIMVSMANTEQISHIAAQGRRQAERFLACLHVCLLSMLYACILDPDTESWIDLSVTFLNLITVNMSSLIFTAFLPGIFSHLIIFLTALSKVLFAPFPF